MSGIVRSKTRSRQQRRRGNAYGEDARSRKLQASHFRVLEFVHRAPDIRPDKVRDMRSKIGPASWNPTSRRVAEKILYEHLFDSAPLYVTNLSRTSP